MNAVADNKPSSIESWLTELGNPSADRDYKPGHERLLKLLASVQTFKPRLRIRVAGTNGKGSTSFMLAAALQAAGLEVGLYTSPHILEFNERIRINGRPVSSELLEQSMATLMPHALKIGTSYFETATAVAFDLFAKVQVDVEILEAGVGARLDATTAVAADMALITPIGIDHQNWLGDSLQQIAQEKSFVMQGCRYAFTAPQSPEVLQTLQAFSADLTEIDILDWPALQTPGEHQHINASLAYAAAIQLAGDGFIDLDKASVKQAITACRVPGRLEKITVNQATVWLDAAHNRHAIEALQPSLKALADPFDAIIVFTREDRSLDDCSELLQDYCYQLVTKAEHESASQALQQQIALNPTGTFLVLGSFITVAEILRNHSRL